MLLLTGCNTGTASPDDEHAPAERPSAAADVSVAPAPSAASTEPTWTPTRRWRRGDQDSFGVATDRHVLLWPSPTGPPSASVQTADGTTLITHRADPAGWAVQDGYLGDDVAVFVDANAEIPLVALTAYRISNGEVLDTSATRRDVLGPETDVADTRLAYARGTPQKGMCLHILDLDDGTDRKVTCDETGVQLGDLALTGDVLTYTRLTASTTPRRCKSLAVVDVGQSFDTHDGAAEGAARDTDPCGNWSAAPLSTGEIVWDNARPEFSLTTAPLFGYADEATVPLGSGYTDSARSCGGWVLWLRPGANGTSEIVGWTPGLTRPVQVRPAVDDVELTLPYCAEDRWLTTRADEISGDDEHLTLWTLDTHSLGPAGAG